MKLSDSCSCGRELLLSSWECKANAKEKQGFWQNAGSRTPWLREKYKKIIKKSKIKRNKNGRRTGKTIKKLKEKERTVEK